MPVRLLVCVAILIMSFLVLFLVLIASETALTVWHYLKEAPLWVQLGYANRSGRPASAYPGAVLELVPPARKKKPVRRNAN